MIQPEPILLFLGFDDVVRCVFCRKYARDWEIQDIPMLEHQKLHPECPFVRGLYVGNIPETQSTLEQEVLPETGILINPLEFWIFWYLPLIQSGSF